ncbi:PqqD family protein [Paenibacillus sp. FSL R5-0623]|uniref:PqqD family protein n=1 Tax=Paenibacillus sp. FSL R5-0623 TaxID=2921651 RepID=UPI0030DB0CDE
MKINPHVRTVDEDGEKVLFDTKRGLFYGIDEIGSDIWMGIESGLNVNAILTLMQHKYADVSRQQLYIDIENFIAELKRNKLIKKK